MLKSILQKIQHILYWIRAHTINKYHIIDIRKFNHNMYDWGWIDADHKILIACFNIFEDFMTNEYPGMIDWDYESVPNELCTPENRQERRDRHATMKMLLNWWQVERKQRHDFA